MESEARPKQLAPRQAGFLGSFPNDSAARHEKFFCAGGIFF
jgi:hypothetical protein